MLKTLKNNLYEIKIKSEFEHKDDLTHEESIDTLEVVPLFS